jgi:hypothetical protein
MDTEVLDGMPSDGNLEPYFPISVAFPRETTAFSAGKNETMQSEI